MGASDQELDHWSSGLRFGVPGNDLGLTPGALQTFVDDALVALAAFHMDATNGVGSACWLDWATAAVIGPDGKYSPPDQETARADRAPLAGGGSTNLPWNTAHVISLRTARPRGYASNGRMYYPCLSFIIDASTGRLAPTPLNNRLSGAKTLLDALNAAATAYPESPQLIVASSVGAGLTATVTHIRADARLDSIERRESLQPAVYVSVDLA